MSDVTITEPGYSPGCLLVRNRQGYTIALGPNDVTALREYFAAERRMPEDVRDLLGELAKYSDEFNYGDYSQDLVKRTRAALDAAYGTGGE